MERVSWWWRAWLDTRGECFVDRLALVVLTRGRRGGWLRLKGLLMISRTDYGVVKATLEQYVNPA